MPDRLLVHRESTEQFLIEESLKIFQSLMLRSVRDTSEKEWPFGLAPGGLLIGFSFALNEQEGEGEVALLFTEEKVEFDGIRPHFKPGACGESGAGVEAGPGGEIVPFNDR